MEFILKLFDENCVFFRRKRNIYLGGVANVFDRPHVTLPLLFQNEHFEATVQSIIKVAKTHYETRRLPQKYKAEQKNGRRVKDHLSSKAA